MYMPIYLLPQNTDGKSKEYQDRWKTKNGILTKHRILKLLREGPTEHFLQKDFLEKKLVTIKDEKDLRGLFIEDEDIKDLHVNTLKGVNLSYSYIINTNFENITFPNMIFKFSTFYKVTFVNCTFSFSTFYASKFENVVFINCNFLDKNELRNCLLENTKFNKCFFENNIFSNCHFDQLTQLEIPNISEFSKKQTKLDLKELSEIYKGIKEAYASGKVINKKRDYYFLEKQAITRFNTKTPLHKFGGYFLELVSGYGIRPLRVLFCMMVSYFIFTTIFVNKIGYSDGLLLSTGAYFTNGANSNFLVTMGPLYQALYILESFLGILLIALFITVMANLWFTEE